MRQRAPLNPVIQAISSLGALPRLWQPSHGTLRVHCRPR